MTYKAQWFLFGEQKYETIEEVVADVIKHMADDEDWQSVEWWGRIMSSGEFDQMTEEDQIKCIKEMAHSVIELEPVEEEVKE